MTHLKKHLFRKEALEYTQERFCGHVILKRPLSLRVATVVFFLLVTLIVVFFCFFSYTRKTQINGILLPEKGLIRIMPADSGLVTHILVKEGELVTTGTPLFLLSNERFSSTQGDTKKIITTLLLTRKDNLIKDYQTLQEQLEKKKIALQQTIDDLQHEERLLNKQILVQQEQIALFQDINRRYSQLLAAKIITPVEMHEKKSELLERQANLVELERRLGTSVRERKNRITELEQLLLQEPREHVAHQMALNAIEKELAENEAQKEMVIKAPQDGIVSTILVSEGQSVQEYKLLATLSPQNSELEANLFASSGSIAFIKTGMPVLLRYHAYPYQKFGQFRGVIREISHSALLTEDLVSSGVSAKQINSDKDSLYRVKVTLDKQQIKAYGEYHPLKTGMTIEASILLEKRKLYEWILEPLYSLNGNK